MTQNEPGGRCADGSDAANPRPSAAPGPIRRGAVIARLPIGNPKELRGGTQLLPQFSGAGIGLARFRRRDAFDSVQHRAQGAQEFELLSLAFRAIRQQRQLVQPFLQLRGRFRHCRAGGGPPTGFAPTGDGFFR